MASSDTDLSGKYEVRHQIGKGSFGSAFLVTNKQDKKDYVLKRVRLAKQTKWGRSSTLQERDLVLALQHPFIVPCVESWMVQDHTVNMIYGYCEKGDLCSYLQKVQRLRGQVEEQLMVKWLCQLLLALDYLQAKRVLHRDIKTSNVLLTSDMDAQLGDFGLATLMQGDGSRPEDNNLVGTPHYMSPELLSCKDYGFKTDVWSLGCVFYELTAQRPTFNAFNIHGLVSKIKKNKLAPLPDGYSNEWREVIGLMLCKNPERRPSVQELMGLPQLRPALLEARQRAAALMPSLKLPPLLDPSPLMMRPRITGDEGVATHSDASADASPDRECLDAVPAGVNEGCDSKWPAGALAAQAIQESELSELWRANSMQEQQWRQQQQQVLEVPQQPEVQAELDSDCHLIDNHGSRCSMSSRASSSLAGSLKAHSPAGGPSALEASKRGHQQVRQPGISRMSPAERVAAAIAAARASKASPAAAPATAPAAPDKQPAILPQPEVIAAPANTGIDSSSRRSSSSNRSTSSNQAPPLDRKVQPSSKAGKPPLPAELGGGSRPPSFAGCRPHSGRSTVSASPRPAWNAGSAGGAPGTLHRQRSVNGRGGGTPAHKAAELATAAVKPLSSSKATKGRSAVSNPGSHSHYLQQLEQQRHLRKQQEQPASMPIEQQQQHVPDSVQRLLDKSQELSRMTLHLQHGMQQPQQHLKPPKLPAPHQAPGGGPAAAELQLLLEQQQQPAQMLIGCDTSDDECSSSEDDSTVKRLQFDSASPGSTPMQYSPGRLSDTPPAAAGPTPDGATPEATTPDMFAAAKSMCVRDRGAAMLDESPVLWSNAAAASGVPGPEQQQEQSSAGGGSAEEAVCSSSGAPADGSSSGVSQCVASSIDNAAELPAVLARFTPTTAAAGDSGSNIKAAVMSNPEKQRLQQLESVLLLIGGLYARRRWQEMGTVLGSAGLLPDAVCAAVHTAMEQGPPSGRRSRSSTASSRLVVENGPSSSGTCGSNKPSSAFEGSSPAAQLNASEAAPEMAGQPALKLGDVVVLGSKQKVKGKIRYIGPVAWDSGQGEWVGMELDQPVGMHGTQHGITYINCPPRCASFHRASQLQSI